MWKRKPKIETAVCPTCRMVHQPDHPIGEFRLYCRTHRLPLEDAAKRRHDVLAWVDRNFDKIAKQYDEHVAAQNAAYKERNQKIYASMAAMQGHAMGVSASAQSGLNAAANIHGPGFGGPNA